MFSSFKKNTKQNGQVELHAIEDQLQKLKAELLLQEVRHEETVNNLQTQLRFEIDHHKKIMQELEVVKANLHEKNNDENVASLDRELEKARNEVVNFNSKSAQLQKDLKSLQEKYDGLINERQEVIKDRQRLWEEYQKLEASSKATEEDRQEIIKDRQRLWEEYQKLDESRNFWRDKAEKLEKDYYSLNEEILSLQNENSKDKKYIVRNESLLKENHLLLIQLRQAQDELTELQLAHQKLQNRNDSISLKWKRLEKRLPNYIDYGGLELVQIDTVGLTPQIVWKVTDYSRGDLALPEFLFATKFFDGNVGIVLGDDDFSVKSDQRVFIPNNAVSSTEQKEMFFEFTQHEWNRILAAGAVLEQLLIGANPLSENSAKEFDISFWRSSLQTFISSLKKLPSILRYEKIKLKRELINADYEHLWLELYGLNFANQRLEKFEMRIGASLIQSDGFSRFPKFEIPLIDGKTQPFKSWFAESHDDQGPKFELRFSLDKSAFDIVTWSKLSKEDQNLLQILLFRLPIILNSLSKKKISIHRPWSQWITFVNAALSVMKKQAISLQKKSIEPEESASNHLSTLGGKEDLQNVSPLKRIGKKSSVTIVSSAAKPKISRVKKTTKNLGTVKQDTKKKSLK